MKKKKKLKLDNNRCDKAVTRPLIVVIRLVAIVTRERYNHLGNLRRLLSVSQLPVGIFFSPSFCRGVFSFIIIFIETGVFLLSTCIIYIFIYITNEFYKSC
jgi:hypothetical protein